MIHPVDLGQKTDVFAQPGIKQRHVWWVFAPNGPDFEQGPQGCQENAHGAMAQDCRMDQLCVMGLWPCHGYRRHMYIVTQKT
jgi:hypothetical protein